MAIVKIVNTLTKVIADGTDKPLFISPSGVTVPCTPIQEYISDMVTITDGTLYVPAYNKVQYIAVPFGGSLEFEISDYKEIAYYQNLVIDGADVTVEGGVIDVVKAPAMTAAAPDFDMFGTLVSELQDGVTVANGAIKGTLNYITSGALVDKWGEGNFLAVQLNADDWSAYTSVKIGMKPSFGDGLVEIIEDPDKNGAFKVTDKNSQKFVVVATNSAGASLTTEYDLSGLDCLSE